jgi:hypothetical protein
VNFNKKIDQPNEIDPDHDCRGDTNHLDPSFAPGGEVNKNKFASKKTPIMLVRLMVLLW